MWSYPLTSFALLHRILYHFYLSCLLHIKSYFDHLHYLRHKICLFHQRVKSDLGLGPSGNSQVVCWYIATYGKRVISSTSITRKGEQWKAIHITVISFPFDALERERSKLSYKSLLLFPIVNKIPFMGCT